MPLGFTKPVTAVEASLAGQPLSIMEFESPSAAVIAEPVPIGSRYATWWIGMFVICGSVIAAFAPLDVVVSETGKVVSTEDTVVVQPLDQSIIKTINARVGQVVKKGDLLATLDPTLTAADTTVYTQQVAALTPELVRLHAERDHKTYVPTNPEDNNQALQLKLFEQRAAQVKATDANYNQQIASLEQQISGNLGQAQYYRQRLGMANDIETLRRDEEQMQVGSKLNSLLAADQRVQMTASMDQAIASAQSEKATLMSTIAQRDAFDAQWDATTAQSINDQQALLDTAKQNLSKSALHGGLVEMRSPNDAVVLQVEKLSVGSVLMPGEQFIQLSPLDQPLEVEAYVSGTDSGWITKGNRAEIKFNTFSYKQYGDAMGRVLSLTTDSFVTPSSGGSGGPMIVSTGTSDPSNAMSQSTSTSPSVSVFYMSRISIEKLNLHDVPRDFRLTPGMPVSVDINVGTRTFLNYILGRVLPVFHEAMREP